MHNRLPCRIAALLAALLATGVSAQQAAEGAGVGAAASRASSRMGQALFQKNCSSCHHEVPGVAAGDGDSREAPALTLLHEFTPERMLAAMDTGKMQPMAAQLTAVQRQQIAEWVTGRPIGSAVAGDMKQMANRCTAAPRAASARRGEWHGWGPDTSNRRFQDARAAGLSAADLPTLEVKWVFAAPTAIEMYSQPTVAAGRIFFSSDSGYVYALDARTGCGYWSYQAAAGVRTAPVFAEVPGRRGTSGVFFADRSGNVYGVDAATGRELWRTRADTLPRTNITGSPTVFGGRLFVADG